MPKKACRALVAAGVLALVVSGGQQAEAVPILGGQLYYTGGNVTVESLVVSSGYVSQLSLYDSSFNHLVYLMNDEPPGVIVNFNPGSYGISIGDELIFGIKILNTGYTYFMGAPTRNPDLIMHATVDNIGGGQFIVGFEDLYGGGDLDYDDNRFKFTGAVTSVPEPGTLGLIGLGLVALARRRGRRQA